MHCKAVKKRAYSTIAAAVVIVHIYSPSPDSVKR